MGLTFATLRICKVLSLFFRAFLKTLTPQQHLQILRVSEEIELEGLDVTKHGEEAYPVERGPLHKLKKQPTTFLKDL